MAVSADSHFGDLVAALGGEETDGPPPLPGSLGGEAMGELPAPVGPLGGEVTVNPPPRGSLDALKTSGLLGNLGSLPEGKPLKRPAEPKAHRPAGQRKAQPPKAPKAASRDLQDWQLDRPVFLRFNDDYGPFTCDAACDDEGRNAQVSTKFFCPARTFLEADVSGDCVWMFPPFSRATEFIQHYLRCKQRDPSTSAVILLPKWANAAWAPMVSGMKLVREFPARTPLFTRPGPEPSGPRQRVGPTPWPFLIFWDPPGKPETPGRSVPPAATVSTLHTSDELLCFEGTICGAPARFLVDSGATQDFISSSFVRSHKVPTARRSPLRVRLANGSLSTTSHVCPSLRYQIASFEEARDFVVTALESYDVILGKTWLTQHNPLIDWEQHSVRLGSTVLHGAKHEPRAQVFLVDARKMMKTLKKGKASDVFLATVESIVEPSEEEVRRPRTDQSEAWNSELYKLLDQFPEVFKEPTGLPVERPHDHGIDLVQGAKPPQQRTYRMSPLELEEVKRQLAQYLEKGWIRPSSSPFGAPILFARKKNGQLRMCVDYRALNALTVKNRYPLPRIDELLDQLHGATIFTALDLWSGYHQVRIKPEDIHKTAFRTRYGHYEFTVLPFGLTNAPATFMGMMNDLMRPYLDKFVIVYIDDILVYSKTPEEHLQHLRMVMEVLASNSLHIQPKKCNFGRSSTLFLGFEVSGKGIRPDPEKVKAVQEWPELTNISEVRSFLGFVGYCRRFIKNFAAIAAPLTELTKSTVPFLWDSAARASFQALKVALTTAPTLALPYVGTDATFTLYADASGKAIAAVLLQDQGKGLQPIAYESRRLNEHEANYPIRELELLAIVHAVRTYRCYLEGCQRFTVLTDHDTLRHFMTQPSLSGRQARWQELLSPYANIMEIKHIKGAENMADALTRLPAVHFLSTATLGYDHDLLEAIKSAYALDPLYLKPPRFVRERDGLYFVGNRLAIPKDNSLRARLLREQHDAPYSGHLGHNKTLASVASRYWWPHLSRSVRAYVSGCAVCQRTKPSSQAPPGLLQPIPIAQHPWEQVSMDLITDLPTSLGYDAIMVFVDTLTKMAHFVPTNKNISAEQTAALFVKHVFCHHGLPTKIISDRDPRFTSDFFTALFRRLGTQLSPSTAYHPQTDGQTERTNRTLEQLLRAYVHPLHDDWADHLHLAEFVYNNAVQASSSVSPFFANFGFHPRTPADPPAPEQALSTPAGTVVNQDILSRIQDTQQVVKSQLEAAQARMRSLADASRRELTFAVGDKVRLSTDNLKLQDQPSRKFRDRYIGPFEIEAVVSPVAYRLKLPATVRIHPVVHVSRLLPWHTDTEFPEHESPHRPAPFASDYVYGDNVFEVDSILDVKFSGPPTRKSAKLLFKTRWVGYDESEDTWQTLASVMRLDALTSFLGSSRWAQFSDTEVFRTWLQRQTPTVQARLTANQRGR